MRTSESSSTSRSASSSGQRQRGAERGRGHRQRDRAVQVVAVAGEGRVRVDVDLDVEVAGRAAAGTDLALLGELDAGAVVDTGRDLDVERATRADAAVARALAARVGDDLAEPAARGARAQGADLAEERSLHLGDLAGTAAGLADDRLGAGRGSVAVTGRAHDRGVDLELLGGAEGRLGELDVEADQGVLAATDALARATSLAAGAGGAAAEERVHDVGEGEALALAEAGLAAAERVAATVVRRTLRRVGEDLVGARDLLELLLRRRVRIDVRVQLAGQASVGLLDGGGVGVAGDSEQLVEVSAHCCPSSRIRET